MKVTKPKSSLKYEEDFFLLHLERSDTKDNISALFFASNIDIPDKGSIHFQIFELKLV